MFSSNLFIAEKSFAYRIVLGCLVTLGMVSWIPYVAVQTVSLMKSSLFVLCLVPVLSRGEIKLSPLVKTMFLYGVILIFPIIYSVGLHGVEQVSAAKYAVIPILIAFIMSILPHRDTLLIVMISFLVGAVLNSLWIVFTWHFNLNVAPYSVVGTRAFLPYSVMGLTNSHTLASPLIGIAIGLVLLGEKFWVILRIKLVRYILLVLMIFAQFLTTGEGGILVTIAALVSVAVIKRLWFPRFFVFLGIFFSIITLSIVGPYLNDSLYASYVEHTAANYAGISIFFDNLIFGTGFEMSYYEFNRAISGSFYDQKIYSDSLTAHMPVILMAAEAGLFGLVAYAFLIMFVIKCLGKMNRDDDLSVVSYFIIVFFFVLSLLEPWPMIMNFYVLFIFYAALNYLSKIQVAD